MPKTGGDLFKEVKSLKMWKAWRGRANFFFFRFFLVSVPAYGWAGPWRGGGVVDEQRGILSRYLPVDETRYSTYLL